MRLHHRTLYGLPHSSATTVAACLLGCAVLMVIPVNSTAVAATKTKPSAGAACPTAGRRAPGTNLDCIKVGTKRQWQPRGSKLNPVPPNEPYEWTNLGTTKPIGATRRLVITGYSADASEWVSSFADFNPDAVFDAAKGKLVRSVNVTYTVVSAENDASRTIGAGNSFWLGDERLAGCCTDGLLRFGQPVPETLVPETALSDGASASLTMLFAATNEELGRRPLMRISWKSEANKQTYAYFAVVG
jgi:hypothetical protein